MTPTRLFIAAAAAFASTNIALAAPLAVKVDGIEARGGTLYVGVQTEAEFMTNGGIAGEMVATPEAGAQTFTFDLPEGAYAVSVWHDFNANAKFDMSDEGLPADGWAMINGETLRGPPVFSNASLAVTEAGAKVSLKVIYPD